MCTSVLGVSFFLPFFFFALRKKTLPNIAVGIRRPHVCDFAEEKEEGWGGGTFCYGSGGCSHAALASKALTLGVHHASCLAHSNGIPGSVPSDCRLAPLPPSLVHTHTHTSQPPSVAVPSSSSLLKCGTARHLHTDCSPSTSVPIFFFRCFATSHRRLQLVSPPADCVCVLPIFLPFFVGIANVSCEEGNQALSLTVPDV